MPQGTGSGQAHGIRLLPYHAQTKGEIVHRSDSTPLPVRYWPERDPSLTVKRVVIVVWPPFHRPRRGSGDGHGTPAH